MSDPPRPSSAPETDGPASPDPIEARLRRIASATSGVHAGEQLRRRVADNITALPTPSVWDVTVGFLQRSWLPIAIVGALLLLAGALLLFDRGARLSDRITDLLLDSSR